MKVGTSEKAIFSEIYCREKARKKSERKHRPRPHTTLAAGVCEVGEERRDCGIFSANYIHPPAPLSCHELLRLHALHTAFGSWPPAHMLPLMLPDYSAAANQYSQALGMGTPLGLLHRVFTRIVCA